MIHASLHWPNVMHDTALWLMAVMHAVYIYNHVPSMTTSLSPTDVFTRSRWEQRKLHDLHVWGCPAYLLDNRLGEKKKIPRWLPRSERTVFVGNSSRHVSMAPMILNLCTGAITTQFHVVFDDWFSTVSSNPQDLPDFSSP